MEPALNPRPLPPWVVAVGAGLVGLAINTLALPVLPGVDFLFGMVPALVVAILLGPGPGALAGVLAALTTILHWDHAAAVPIFALHAATVGWLARRMSPLAASLVYWLLPGTLLIWLLYSGVMGLPAQLVWPVAVKQPLNGWLNVLFAMAITAMLPRHGPVFGRLSLPPRQVPLQRMLLLVMVLLAMVPIVLAGSTFGKVQWSQEQRQLELTQRKELQSLSQALIDYMEQHRRAIEVAAQFLGRVQASPEQQQALLEVTRTSIPGFVNLYIGDADGRARFFSPDRGPGGGSPVGHDFSDRNYFRELRAGERHVISNVFWGRGGTDQAIVVMAEPIQRRGRFDGYVLGAVDLRALETQLRPVSREIEVHLVDRQGRPIISPGAPALRNSQDAVPFERPHGKRSGQTTYLQSVGPELAVRALERRLVTYQQVPEVEWTLWVETPMRVIQERVQAGYLVVMLWMALGVMLTFLVSHMLSRYLAGPILLLARRSQAFAAGESGALAAPGASPIVELDTLARNLSAMASEVQQKESQLERQVQARTAELQLANAQLMAAIEELRHLDRAKADFLNMVSHELRTPLNFITGFASILEDEVSGALNEAQHAQVQRILEGGDRLLGLVNDLLDYARLEAGNFKAEPVSVALAPVVARVIADLEPIARQSRLTLTSEVSPGLPPALADPLRLEQVLYNLVGNALKFTPPGGSVRVLADRPDGLLRVRVIDTGIGIPAEAQPYLFQRFYQVDSSSTRPFGGTGLGLAISKALVELMGGTIGVESEVGKGTTFWFTLPTA